jgi:hypothetical protein
VPNRLAREKNPSKKCMPILELVRTLVTGSSTQTDTLSLVFVAVSKVRPRFATHFATNQRFGDRLKPSRSRPQSTRGEGGVLTVRGADSQMHFPKQNFFSKCERLEVPDKAKRRHASKRGYLKKEGARSGVRLIGIEAKPNP